MINLIAYKKILMISIYLFFPIISNVIGQKDYKNGFIIRNNNDTIYGLINLQSNYFNSLECEFRKNIDTLSEFYTPFDIKAFFIENNKYYISKDMTINNIEKKVFLEFLLKGIVNLYYYKDLQNEYYFIEKDNEIFKLTNELIEIDRNNNTYRIESHQYIGILKFLFQDSPKLTDQINNTRFGYKPLIKVTKTYHENVCKDYKCVDFTKLTKQSIYIEPKIGIINSKLGLASSKDYTKDLKAIFVIQFRFIPIRMHYLWNFQTGLSYSSNYFLGDYFNYVLFGKERTFRIELKYEIIRIPLIIQYNFPLNKIQPYILAGYNNIFIINPKYSVRRISEEGSLSSPYKTPFRKYQFGFTTGVGLRFKINEKYNIFIQNDYEYRMPSSNYNYILDFHNVKSIIFNLGFDYKFQ